LPIAASPHQDYYITILSKGSQQLFNNFLKGHFLITRNLIT